ncbi:hypothetical protein O23A_p3732 [Aeromonas salmonicida]|nr:hypothetical protein O23A_p3732 [Aeromonas salmonicida]
MNIVHPCLSILLAIRACRLRGLPQQRFDGERSVPLLGAWAGCKGRVGHWPYTKTAP